MIAALEAEWLKLRLSLVGRVTTAAVVVGIVVLSSVMFLAARSGREDLVVKLGPDATPDWHGYLSAALQITAAGGLAGYAILLAWMVGREFADGAISGLFALPVGRGRLIAAKLLVFGGWGVEVAILAPTVLLGVGFALGLGAVPEKELGALIRLVVLGVLATLLATPVALAASWGRSVLAGVGVAFGLIVVAQITALSGSGSWVPLAAPALWALSGGSEASLGQALLAVPFGGLCAGLSILAWRRLEIDR